MLTDHVDRKVVHAVYVRVCMCVYCFVCLSCEKLVCEKVSAGRVSKVKLW